jgi:hypothetical protein
MFSPVISVKVQEFAALVVSEIKTFGRAGLGSPQVPAFVFGERTWN